MSTAFRTLVLASSVIVWAAAETEAAEYQCLNRDASLRIAIEVKKAGHTLPCEVVVEDNRGVRDILYKAQYDRDYCPARLERTRGELEAEGWTCQQTEDENVVNLEVGLNEDKERISLQEKLETAGDSEPPVRNGKVVVTSRQCRLDDDTRLINIEVEDATNRKPCELIYWADGDRTQPGQLLWRAEHDAAFCPSRLDVIIKKWTDQGWTCGPNDPQLTVTADASPEPETVAALEQPSQEVSREEPNQAATLVADSELEAIIASDAERIGEWMNVDPAFEIAARGDLNDDGNDDAVVFLAYESEQAAYRQYLMSYLVNGNSYELASVKLLTGVSPPPAQARVEQIDNGVIWLTLPDEDGSAAGQTGFRLDDQELVEVEPVAAEN